MAARRSRLTNAALIVLAIGWLPLLLYIPYDALRGGGGNPIGLGLLMVLSTFVGGAMLVVAGIRRALRGSHPR
jgi:hypothetical protein